MVTFDKPYVVENVTASNYTADDVIGLYAFNTESQFYAKFYFSTAQINYIVDKIGIDYVGIGGSYDSTNT